MKPKNIDSIESLQAYRRYIKRELEQTEYEIEESVQPFLHPLQTIESYVDDEIFNENSVLDKISNVLNIVNKGLYIAKWGQAIFKTFKKRYEAGEYDEDYE